MLSPVDLADLESRPTRYWNVDGIPQLVMGIVWTGWGAALLVGEALPRDAANWYWMIVMASIVVGGAAAASIVQYLKTRITYPRTGYVAYPEPSMARRLVTAGVAMLAAAIMAALVSTRAPGAERAVAPVFGVLLSLAFLVASMREGEPHWLALAGVAVALGLGFGALRLGWSALNGIFVVLGLTASLLGARRLRSYAARHPREAVR